MSQYELKITGLTDPDTHVVNLEGCFVMPRLYDTSMHVLPVGIPMSQADPRHKVAPTLAALPGTLRARAGMTPNGDWVWAAGSTISSQP